MLREALRLHQLRCCTADFAKIATPSARIVMLAHIGNSITVSFGINSRRVSPREYSPPIPAVVNIKATETIPKLECRKSTVEPHIFRRRSPIANPAEVIDRSNLFANIGLSIPSPLTAFIPLTIAKGVAIHPARRAQWATASLELGPLFRAHRRKATPESAKVPTVNSVVITWKVLAEIIGDPPGYLRQRIHFRNIPIVP